MVICGRFITTIKRKGLEMWKPIISLILLIAIGTLGAIAWGDGVLDFRVQAKAGQALNEAQDIQEAMDAYAFKYGEGDVDFGDVTAGEDLLKYLKYYNLIKSDVGTDDTKSQVERWVYDEPNNQILGVIANERTCLYMNSIRSKKPIATLVPECGSVEAEALPCCQDSTGQLDNVLQTP